MGCIPVELLRGKTARFAKSGKHPTKVGKRPINQGKRPIKATVLIGLFSGTPAMAESGPSKKAHQEVYESLTFSYTLRYVSLVARAIRNAMRANRFARSIRNWTPLFL